MGVSSSACRIAPDRRTRSPSAWVSTAKSSTPGADDRRARRDRRLVVEQQRLLEADVADLGGVAQDRAGGGRAPSRSTPRREVLPRCESGGHRATGAPRCRPRPARRGARAPRTGARARRAAGARPARRRRAPVVLALAAEHQLAVGPGGQRRVDQLAVGVGDGEVDRGTGGEHVGDETAQARGQFLLAPHGRQGGDRHVEAAGVLLDGVGQQRVRRHLGEHAEPVVERGLHGRAEPDREAQVVGPVVGGERRAGRADPTASPSNTGPPACAARGRPARRSARRGSGRPAASARRRPPPPRAPSRPSASQAATRSRTVWVAPPTTVDVGEATTEITTSVTPRIDSSESTCCAGSSTDAMAPVPATRPHQLGPAADDPQPVLERQRARDDGRRGLTERVPDDRAGDDAVGLHRLGQRDLHREQRRLDAVDARHRLRRRDGLGHREARLARRSPARSRRSVAANTGSVASSSAPILGHCEPWPENTHTGPRSSWPTGGLDRNLAVGDVAQRGDQFGGGARRHRRAHRPVGPPARQGVAQVGQRDVVACVVDPVGEPAGRHAQLLGGRGRQREAAAVRRSSGAAASGSAPARVPARGRRARWCPTCRTTRPRHGAAGRRRAATACCPAARTGPSRSRRSRRAAG